MAADDRDVLRATDPRDVRLARALVLACRVGVVIAIAWIGYGLWRLALQPTPLGAIDLRLRRIEVQQWFAGEPLYATNSDAVYPPTSYVLLWPFVGPFGVTAARWTWLVVSLGLLRVLLLQARARARGPIGARALVVATAASYPIGATLGNGQLGLVILVSLLALLPRLEARGRTWRADVAIAGLAVVALVKPSLTAYFFWLVLFAAGSVRPAALTVLFYGALTAFASLFQDGGPVALLRAWLHRGVVGAAYGAKHGGGAIRAVDGGLAIKSVNLHAIFSALGWQDHLMAGSLAVLALLGTWVFVRRRSSIWILAGVCAQAALFASYNGWYDHVLMILPLIALFTLAQRPAARLLAAALALSLLAPGGLYVLPQPWSSVWVLGQAVLWLAVFLYLVRVARPPVGAAPA